MRYLQMAHLSHECMILALQFLDAFLQPVGVPDDAAFEFNIQIDAGTATAVVGFTDFLREADVKIKHESSPR